MGFEKLLNNGAGDAVPNLFGQVKVLVKQVADNDLDLRNLPPAISGGLRILTDEGQSELFDFLGLVRDHGVPGELIHVGTPSNGGMTLLIMPKGAFRAAPALTDSAVLSGAPVTLAYRQPEPITALTRSTVGHTKARHA